MRSRLAWIALVLIACFGSVALASHVATYLGHDVGRHSVPFVVSMFGAFVTQLLTILVLGSAMPSDRELQGPAALFRIAGASPWWTKVLFGAAIVGMLAAMSAFPAGVPSIIDGKHVIHNHGNVIRELTIEQFDEARRHVTRMMTSVVLVFYTLQLVLATGTIVTVEDDQP